MHGASISQGENIPPRGQRVWVFSVQMVFHDRFCEFPSREMFSCQWDDSKGSATRRNDFTILRIYEFTNFS